MEMEEFTVKYPTGFEYAVRMTKTEFEQHIRLMAALKMFELAGMSRVEFLETCGRYRVSIFNYPPEEVENELKKDLDTLDRLENMGR